MRWVLLGAVVLAVAACSDDDASTEQNAVPPSTTAGDGEPVTVFTWTTTMENDGSGYVLVVEGTVGDDHAAYTMQVDPISAGGTDVAGMLPLMAGGAVNGFAGDTTERISTDGHTEVRVLGDDRWYRNPWLLDEADFAMGDAEWVRVEADEPVIADVVTAVLNERYDDAVRELLDQIEGGGPLEAPATDPVSQLDEILTPWVGLVGPDYPIGAQATVDGDATAGRAEWTKTLAAETEGIDGEHAGTVEWETGSAEPPEAPDGVIDARELTPRMAG